MRVRVISSSSVADATQKIPMYVDAEVASLSPGPMREPGLYAPAPATPRLFARPVVAMQHLVGLECFSVSPPSFRYSTDRSTHVRRVLLADATAWPSYFAFEPRIAALMGHNRVARAGCSCSSRSTCRSLDPTRRSRTTIS